MHAFLSGHPTSKTKAELQLNTNKPIRGLELILQPNGIHLKLPPINGNFNPKELIKNELLSNKNVNITFTGSDSNKAIISLTKAAYLMMFRLFGYEFIFSENASKLRDIIFEREAHPLLSKCLLSFDAPTHFVGVSMISHPKNLACYLCTIPLKDTQSNFQKNYAIVMPGAGDLGWKNYMNFANLELGYNINTRIRTFDNTPCYLESILEDYTNTWQHYYNQD